MIVTPENPANIGRYRRPATARANATIDNVNLR